MILPGNEGRPVKTMRAVGFIVGVAIAVAPAFAVAEAGPSSNAFAFRTPSLP
jgi:hypothetical protein